MILTGPPCPLACAICDPSSKAPPSNRTKSIFANGQRWNVGLSRWAVRLDPGAAQRQVPNSVRHVSILPCPTANPCIGSRLGPAQNGSWPSGAPLRSRYQTNDGVWRCLSVRVPVRVRSIRTYVRMTSRAIPSTWLASTPIKRTGKSPAPADHDVKREGDGIATQIGSQNVLQTVGALYGALCAHASRLQTDLIISIDNA